MPRAPYQPGTSAESEYVPSSDSSDAVPRTTRAPPAPWKYHEKCSNDHVAAACKQLGAAAAAAEAAAAAAAEGNSESEEEEWQTSLAGNVGTVGTGERERGGNAGNAGKGSVMAPKCMKRVLEEANWKRMAIMLAIKTRHNGVRRLDGEISSFSKPKPVHRVDPRDELLRELEAIKAAGARR
ncbi:hypothetical protein BZA05DRAFT_226587 [Tricharina praecox]|uniref:uncharacterized protein n=1 Tax=Tricharina praecox TaxID=43433 RepID=UPI0022209DFD|nr:uncharacterized protein BZA05DRAFT_226587 [Tricharina praecox]KAI5856103.1 hypothetical protein BZA05DRAFT_226587 [Tricharina praecox]